MGGVAIDRLELSSPLRDNDGDGAAAADGGGAGEAPSGRAHYGLFGRDESSPPDDDDSDGDPRLPPVLFRLPNTAFGISMGLAGHAIAWKEMRSADFVGDAVGVEIVDALNAGCWYACVYVSALNAICYVYKMTMSFPLVKAEYLNEVRCHFFNAPNLIVIMLLISVPPSISVSSETVRAIWALTFCYQIVMTQYIYQAWMFSKRRNFTEAKPQFLMSTVGWFLLSNLGYSCGIPDAWGIGLPQMCFGAGFILYIDIVIFIFGRLHDNRDIKGSPAMFLLIAPPSVGVVSLDFLNDLVDGATEFSPFSEMLLGWVFVLLLLLIRMCPTIWRSPSVLGEYWAYATTATIRYASAMNTTTTEVLAIVMILMAISSLLLVFGRMTFHMYQCLRGKDQWRDPLFRMEKYSARPTFIHR